jgi:hypothetical protein
MSNGDPTAPEEGQQFGRRPEDREVLVGQKKFALVAGWVGIFVLLFTLLFPLAGAIAPLVGWGCAIVTVDGGDPTRVCSEIESPFGLWGGVSIAFVCMLGAAAFAQVAVGGVGVGMLRLFKPGSD